MARRRAGQIHATANGVGLRLQRSRHHLCDHSGQDGGDCPSTRPDFSTCCVCSALPERTCWKLLLTVGNDRDMGFHRGSERYGRWLLNTSLLVLGGFGLPLNQIEKQKQKGKI